MNAADFYNLIAGNTPIAALIGGTPAVPGGAAAIPGRIYWNVEPQDELRSCLVLAIPDELIGQSLAGPDGYESADVTITCFAPTYAEARNLALVATVELDGQEVSGATLSVESREDVPSVPADGQATPLVYGVVVNVTIEV
jgi:hypothetical protein